MYKKLPDLKHQHYYFLSCERNDFSLKYAEIDSRYLHFLIHFSSKHSYSYYLFFLKLLKYVNENSICYLKNYKKFYIFTYK